MNISIDNIFQGIRSRFFNRIVSNRLVYNTCWEDPRIDRAALELGSDDTVLVITSAGCNALDYALTEPKHVYAVDMNPRQNALLELKLAGIANLEFGDFYRMFGEGRLPGAREVYGEKLRDALSPWAQRYWDRRIRPFFDNRRQPFYFRGTSGMFARMLNLYIDKIVRIRPGVEAILEADSVDRQREIYETQIRDKFWTRPLRFAVNRDATLSLVGVPKAQRLQVETYYGRIARFVQDCVEAVLTRLPLADNYFWRVYMTGAYAPDCCPEYLKPENFAKLKDGLVDRVTVHTNSVQGFLEQNDVEISRYVLLDHMDWLSDKFFPLLEAEWQAILRRSALDARVIWRSGGMRTDYVDRVKVDVGGHSKELRDLLHYHRDLADQLHEQCRVHTYGSFHIADLAA